MNHFFGISSFFFLLLCSPANSNNINEIKERVKRFSIFSLVQFPNTQCILAMSTPTTTMMGTCFTSSECASNGGTASGNCASGFGVCCMFGVTACGSTVSRNCTYIQNPGAPSSLTTTGTCNYNFQASTDICQIRLDFNDLTLANPIANVCSVDTFKVTSSSSQGSLFAPVPPVLCGALAGSHMWIETGRVTNAGSITITTGILPGVTATRSWKIKTTFVECGNPGSAPTDCTQYFTAISGTFQSYNFNNGAGAFIEKQNYNICVRQAEGFCRLGISQDTSIVNSFMIDAVGANIQSMHACTSAALFVPTTTAILRADQLDAYCGGYLNQLSGQTVGGEVFANVNPWEIGVFSKNAPLNNVNTGFKLLYQQMPCI